MKTIFSFFSAAGKQASFFIALIVANSVVVANVTNDGATITILSGTTVTVLGDVDNKTGSTITNGGVIELVDGEFLNDGANAIGGLIKFLGDDGAIGGTSTFKDVEIDCNNGITVFGPNNIFDENLFVKKGNIASFSGPGSINYGTDANLEYNGITVTIPGLEFPPHLASYNPKTVTINNTAGVNMNSLPNTKQVLGTLVLKAGTLTSNGKLILASNASRTAIVDDFSEGNPSSTIVGSMTVERYVQNPPAIAFPGYHGHYIASPLVGANVAGWADDFDVSVFNGAVNGTPVIPQPSCNPSALAAGSPYGRVYTYHEDLLTFCYQEGWRVRTGAHPVERGVGFSANIPTTGVIDQTGTYSNANVVLSNLSNSGNPSLTFHKALHLVSNPFCAPLDWSQNYTLNGGSASDIDGNAYLYNPDGGVWVVYNGANLNSGIIGTSQAFHIRAKDAIRATNNPFNFTLHQNARVTTGNNTFYRQQSSFTFGYNINLTGPNSRWDKTALIFDDNFTDQYDNFYDADKMMSTPGSPSLYTKMPDGYNLAIQALPVNTNIITVPLSLKPEINGSFTLDFEELQSLPGTMMVTLEDTHLNIFQNIRVNNQYTFTASKTDNPDRFLIHFTPQLVANITNATCNGNNDAFIALDQQGGVEWDYNLVDASSNIVASGVAFTGIDTISNLSPGTYTLELSHSSGYTTSEVYTVSGAPLVSATIDASSTTIEQNEIITLDAVSSTATNFTWDMCDGTVYNSQSTVEHSYAQPGTYEVVLIADNGVCSDNQTMQIVVSEAVVTSILNDEAGKLWAYHYADKLYFKQTLNNESTTLNATLYNTLGQIVVTVSESSLVYNQVFTAPLENIASGTYVLHTKAGDKVTVRKIVINK